jgi:DNA (cytosine-5)-methyltransferase 1
MNVLDLFSGIGGFSLGLERAGMRTVAFCEIDAKARQVLAKHWPSVPTYEDVRTLTSDRLRADGIRVDAICGGFPCQDISLAGAGAGLEGERSGLWFEYARIIGEIRPRYVIVENVAALLGRGLDRVLRDLAAIGYDAEWHCIPASALGARHRRDRIWIVAYPASPGREAERLGPVGNGADPQAIVRGPAIPYTDSARLSIGSAIGRRLAEEIIAYTRLATERCGCALPDADSEPQEWAAKPWCERHPWAFEPNVGRVANGVSGRVDRLKQLGNSVVPQIPEIIGRAIMTACRSTQLPSQARNIEAD